MNHPEFFRKSLLGFEQGVDDEQDEGAESRFDAEQYI